MPDAYEQLVLRRSTLLEDIDANTLILNLYPGFSFASFCINYVINLFRILFPLELIRKIKYIPFVVYQLYLTYNLFLGLKNNRKEQFVNLSFLLAYTLMLVASESDFGTLVRHQSVLMFSYLYLINSNLSRGELDEKN